MPPKKSKRVEKKFTPKKIYEFFTEEQMIVKKQNYANHLRNLKDCMKCIAEASYIVEEFSKQQSNMNKWQEYLNCCPLPKAYRPSDIRSFIEKLKYFENISKEEKAISWLLSSDQRSILTQNVCHKDLTHSTLKLQNKTSFGWEYNEYVNNCLRMIERMDDFLEKGFELSDKFNDIQELRNTLQHQISEFLNRYTYRILCSEESYMSSIDATTTEYCFEADNFQIHIWCLKNVPIRFQQLDFHVTANLHGLKVALSIPTFIMKENLTIRGLHFIFDHISGNVEDLLREGINYSSEGSGGSSDLRECLENERLMQLEIQNRVRNQLLQERQQYEEELKLFAEQEINIKNKKKQADANKESGKIKPPKLVKPAAEPFLTNDDMFPDIWEEFLEDDQKQYDNYFNSMCKHSPLESHEINLRKYFILGGIYQLHEVQKPKHVVFNSLNMTRHTDKSQLVINKDLVIPSHVKYTSRSSKVSRRETNKSLSIKIDEFTPPIDEKCPFFVLTIELPDYLCYWGQPIVCQYETVKTKSDELKAKANELQTPKQQLPPLRPPQKRSSGLKLQEISKENIFISSTTNDSLDFSGENRARDVEGALNIYDFPLNSLLSKAQIRQIERHVFPRMISSFKFNKDIQEELQRRQVKSTTRTKGGILIRRHGVKIERTSDTKRHLFGVDAVENIPERLIPIYMANEPIRILQPQTTTAESSDSVQDPKTFAQLLQLIDSIKRKHKLQPRKILQLKPFKSTFLVVNKRLKSPGKEKWKMVLSKTKPPVQSSKSRGKSLVKERSSKITLVESFQSDLNQPLKEDLPLRTYWTNQHILKSEYDREKRTVIIETNRLGYFGFAFKQYEHFPFKSWKLEPNPNNPTDEIIFTLDTQYVTCILYIKEKGIRVRVIEPVTKYISKPKMYLFVDEPISNMKQLKKIFREKFLNIFPNRDASCYIENGYFSEKHLHTERHTYTCMAVNCTQIKFSSSQWNCLAQRRDIILKFLQFKDNEQNTVEVRITPEEAFFIEISELCSNNLDIIKLKYDLSWRNIGVRRFYKLLNKIKSY